MFSSQTINKKIITGILAILIVLALIFSKSRGGQVVLVVQLLCILTYLVQKKDHDQIRNFLAGGVLTVVLYVGLIYLIKVSVDQYYDCTPNPTDNDGTGCPPSIANVFTGENHAWDNLANRLVFWETGWESLKTIGLREQARGLMNFYSRCIPVKKPLD